MAESFVVDNSVVMAWCFQDESDTYSDNILNRLNDAEALVPSIWMFEVVNVLLVAERNNRITPSDSLRFLSLLMQLPFRIETVHMTDLMRGILDIGRHYRLSAYDAAYLELAMLKGVPLATRDKQLAAAASASGVVVL
jgi:predicted nucleic acid-binding protein